MSRAIVLVLVLPLVACAPSGPKDVTEQRHDVVTNQQEPGYEYVVKIPHGVVAVAESRGLGKDDVKAAVGHVAKSFDACLTELEKKAPLKQGAVRVVVPIDDGGLVTTEPLVKVSDDTPETKVTALLCLVAPAKRMSFPAPGAASADAGTRGMAIEATWPNPN